MTRNENAAEVGFARIRWMNVGREEGEITTGASRVRNLGRR